MWNRQRFFVETAAGLFGVAFDVLNMATVSTCGWTQPLPMMGRGSDFERLLGRGRIGRETRKNCRSDSQNLAVVGKEIKLCFVEFGRRLLVGCYKIYGKGSVGIFSSNKPRWDQYECLFGSYSARGKDK